MTKLYDTPIKTKRALVGRILNPTLNTNLGRVGIALVAAAKRAQS